MLNLPPRELSWKILSCALRAPPPMTRSCVLRPLEVSASSQTSSHQTEQALASEIVV